MKLTTNNNPTAILASFSTLKSMVDAKQYRSPYSILGEFIQYIIVKSHIRYFAAVEMKNHLLKSFGFDVPEAVVRTATRALKFIRTENNLYYVDGSELKDNTSFEEKKFAAETSNAEIIKLLISFIQETNTLETIMVDELTQEFIAYLLDDQQTTVIGRYTDLISRFILKYESDEKVESALKAIREGSIIYIGINRNINETGSLSRPLTLFLGTEVLFSLYGYNGEIYKQLAHDLYNQIKVANDGTKRISLCFFKDVKKEIEDFFNSATQIVEGKQQYFETVAMKAIVNGCTTAGDVYVKKADFFHALQYTYGIVEDARTSYYDMESEAYNLEELSTDQQMYDSIKIISHINKLRKGMLFLDILNSGYLAVTNTVELSIIVQSVNPQNCSKQPLTCFLPSAFGMIPEEDHTDLKYIS